MFKPTLPPLLAMSGRNMSGDGISTRETTFKKSTKTAADGAMRRQQNGEDEGKHLWCGLPYLLWLRWRWGWEGARPPGSGWESCPRGCPPGQQGYGLPKGGEEGVGGCGVRCTEGYNTQWDVIIQTILRNTTMAEIIDRTGSTSIKCNYILITEQVGFKYQQCSLK